ncbi:MAG: TolC family protein [Candidatus Omnitrophica bacterium]|nr:TolC family protein [Candidatus Omnitrophota bacterium]
MNKFRYFILLLIITGMMAGVSYSEDKAQPSEEKILSFNHFLELATKNDSEFEEILVDELMLKYQKSLNLPAKDLVLSVKQQHDFFFSQDRDSPNTTVSLTKLFPYSGTEISLDYKVSSSLSSESLASKASFGISQPIAENAFGHSIRLLDKIVGLEVDVARYQIVEAYEDYLALVATAYYNWFRDYKNLEIGQKSYQANLKLLEDIYQRKKEKIAQSIDVNKVKLQVMAKEERLIELQEQYENSLNTIKKIIRYKQDLLLVPIDPNAIGSLPLDFESSFEKFYQESRTFSILNKLEKKSGLQVARDADTLLPSINLLIGYEISGDKYPIKNEDNLFYAGMQLDWPFGHQIERAEYEISKILERRSKLTTENTYHRLYTQLRNLYLQLKREKKLIEITDKRIELAKAVLEDEAENYSFGRVTLNDYIQAVNALDSNRFNKILHEVLYKKLLVEWLRLTDRMVQYRNIEPEIKDLEKE